MKSEKEFLDEIYKKADLEKKKSKKKVWQSSFVAAAVVGVILLPYAVTYVPTNEKGPANGSELIRTATIQESIFDGCITTISYENHKVILQVEVDRQYHGTVSELVRVEYAESDKYPVKVGEKALFYTIPLEGSYAIDSNSNGICVYLGEQDHCRQYQTLSGEIINMSKNEK